MRPISLARGRVSIWQLVRLPWSLSLCDHTPCMQCASAATTTYRSVSMSFVRALAARVFRNKRKDREELDIWRLYHFISYRKQISEGAKEAADLEYPNQRASYKKQYSTVHSAVTQQVSL